MGPELVLRPRRDGRLELRFSSGFRIVFGFFAGMLLIGIASADEPALLPVLVLLVLIAGLLYDERWTFEAGTGRIVHRIGLLFACRSREYRFAEVESVELRTFRKGSLGWPVPQAAAPPPLRQEAGRNLFIRSWTGLSLNLSNGGVRDIDTRSSRGSDPLRRTGERIAAYVGKPFIVSG